MSNHKQTKFPDYARTTYQLGCTHSANPAKLDFKTHTALGWVDRWVQTNGGLKAPRSGLLRRAVALYVQHLQSMDPNEIPQELRSVKAACRGTAALPEDIKAIEARLGGSGDPLQPFEVVLLGQHQVNTNTAFVKHLEQLVNPPAISSHSLDNQ